MILMTSPQFVSAAAAGTDWRDTSKKVLEAIQSVQTSDGTFNFGFIYITDVLCADANSILTLFRSVTGIEHWVGCVAISICANGKKFTGEPAISVMIGNFEPDQFQTFPATSTMTDQAEEILEPWLSKHEPMLVTVHGDPMAEEDPAQILEKLDHLTGGFIVGGLSSSRHEHFQFSDDLMQGGISGAVFSTKIPVATALSQGCTPISPIYTVTSCADDHVIAGLDKQDPFDLFSSALKEMVQKKTGQNPDDVLLEESQSGEVIIPQQMQNIFKGDIHVAFPVSGTDQTDFLVRNIIGIDPDQGYIAVGQNVQPGDHILFVHRDDDSVRADLSRMLIDLRSRVSHEQGHFNPKGALYISCIARAFPHDSDNDEMAIIQEVIGDIPLTGFYAGGEISNHRLYGYTGILILFL